MYKCEKCGEYRFAMFGGKPAVCNCKEFIVINEDGDEYPIRAMDEQGAALKYAEESNIEGDYYLMNESVVITINGKEFEISAEPDVHYSANEL